MIAWREPAPEIGAGRRGWPQRAAAAFAFWSLFVSLATTYAIVATGYEYTLAALPNDLILVMLGALFALAMQQALSSATNGTFPRQVLIAAAIVAATAPVFEAAFQAARHLVGYSPEPPRLDRVLRTSLFWLAPFGLWAAINLALFHDREARAREQRVALFRAQAHDAQLRALRYQVNPHFLYNTLNSIAALILDRRNDAAERMVVRLADFFRASLGNDPLGDVPLAEELALQKLYLDIEEVRFADSFRVEFDVADEVATAPVPSLILQPIVENALRHGMNEPGTATVLRLAAWRADDRLLVEITDNGPGASRVGGTGVGLANVRRRLEARFGDAARLEVGGAPGAGFRVRLEMPLVGA